MAVARVLLNAPNNRHYGWRLSRTAGERSATVYRTLDRMLEAGWIADGWEDPNAIDGRPRRRYYTVTDRGRVELETFVGDDERG